MAVSAHERHGMRLASGGSVTEKESTMSHVHMALAWGGIIGVTVLGCLAGCSLKPEPLPLPSVPHAHEEAPPAPVPQVPALQTPEAAPAGKPATTQIGMASWYGP